MKKALAAHGPAAAMAILIFALSSIPSLSPPVVLGIDLGDKALHAMEYALFGFLLHRSAVGLARPGLPPAAAAGVFGILYGLSDEIHQWFVPGRLCDPRDFAADAVGTVAGVLFAVWLSGRTRRRKPAG
jgi:VanZ family protein